MNRTKQKLIAPQIALRKMSSKQKAAIQQRFFKTGPGQYGEGDIFIGVTVPEIRTVAKAFAEVSVADTDHLLKSPVHEDRLLGLLVIVKRYEKEKSLENKKRHVEYYLSHRDSINNWDLVDVTVYKTLGDYCLRINDAKILDQLSKSNHHWSKRMAIVATFAFIRKAKLDLTFKYAEFFLKEKEDLMHKATGWMLREAGKKDKERLFGFIKKFGKAMPRTMLRYAIEKFPETQRKQILLQTRC
jgi:3-methyladenine DNA glycosylase AlkD